MTQIASIKTLVKLWPSRKAMAEDVGATLASVNKWAQSGSIPAWFHGAVLRAAKTRGIEVTAEDLVRLHDLPQAAMQPEFSDIQKDVA